MSGYVGSGYDPDNQDLAAYASGVADQYGIPGDAFLTQIGIESGWNPNAYNAASGAEGIGQVLPSTAANPGYGVSSLSNPYDPYASISFMGQYDSALYNQTGSWGSALTAYNVGVGGNAAEQSSEYANLVANYNEGSGNVNGSGVPVPSNLAECNGDALCEDAAAQGEMSGGYSNSGVDQAAVAAGASALSPASWLVSVEAWASQGALNVAVIVIGVVLLAAGLFALAGGKPRDILAVAAE